MTHRAVIRRIASAAGALVLLASAFAGSALPGSAATGIAWDQVTKFSMDGSVPQPNFAADFQAASQPQAPPPQRGGVFGALGGAMGAAMGAATMFQRGTAERHYVAGNLRRTDHLGSQTATIVDCGARTLTYLDLAKKTYRVESMDRPAMPAQGGSRGPAAAPQDDGTRYTITYSSQALGPKQIDGVNTDGYAAKMTVTATKPSGDSQTFDTNVTAYYAGYSEPQQSCPSALYAGGPAGAGAGPLAAIAGSMSMMNRVNAAMRTSNGDPRFTFSSTGPQLPSGKLDMFSAWQMQAPNGNGRAMTIVTERGNVHEVSDTDQSIFGIPPGFTKEN